LFKYILLFTLFWGVFVFGGTKKGYAAEGKSFLTLSA